MKSDSIGKERAARILIVEDEAPVRNAFVTILEESGHYCQTAVDGEEALKILSEDEFDLILSDIRMPGMDGLTLLSELGGMGKKITTIVITSHDDIDLAVEATRRGAYDFLNKPVDKHRLRLAVARAIEHQRLVSLNQKLTRRVEHPPTFENLIGKSGPMLDVFRMIAQAAPTYTNILITGESGTGKEQVAKAIHNLSRRREKRFTVIDCAALPENLIESVLFGHKRGAFTGAHNDYAGLIGFSDGGTVFFDEIGELPLHVQAKLLRVIQERSFTPVGGSGEKTVDIRIIAATNRELEAEVAAKRFREDLFYRLNVIPIFLPPLRERGIDIEELAFFFLSEIGERIPDNIGISREALGALQTYSWPGNVRELRNAIEHATSLAATDTIMLKDLPKTIQNSPPSLSTPTEPGDVEPLEDRATFLARVEREYLSRLLIRHSGNVSHAAKHAGVSRTTLYELLKNTRLNPRDFKKL